MKRIQFFLLALAFLLSALVRAQTTVEKLDLEKYSGKWYIVAAIPTRFDQKWDYVSETYTLTEKGRIDIYTTYRLQGDKEDRDVKSKGFPVKNTNNTLWRVQFLWPFRIDYLVDEVAPDYSYAVVGERKRQFLYILSRTKMMDGIRYSGIIDRCAKLGYDVSKIKKINQ